MKMEFKHAVVLGAGFIIGVTLVGIVTDFASRLLRASERG